MTHLWPSIELRQYLLVDAVFTSDLPERANLFNRVPLPNSTTHPTSTSIPSTPSIPTTLTLPYHRKSPSRQQQHHLASCASTVCLHTTLPLAYPLAHPLASAHPLPLLCTLIRCVSSLTSTDPGAQKTMSFENRLDAAAAASGHELFDAAVDALGFSPRYAHSSAFVHCYRD